MTPQEHHAARIPSPVGDLLAVVDLTGALVQLDFEGGRNAPTGESDLEELYQGRGVRLVWDGAGLAEVRRQLASYFAGERTAFELALAPAGTPFQLRVWSELQRIAYGETLSYGELARRIGSPKASRAVGLANGANPISIVIPCHRVIGADGSLTGYGGGMERKRALLELEGAIEPSRSLFLPG
ncbi:MAG TPA: methylated-DNA--[protein]-cysteine S-methyltransferase [Planctomycetes bacterium]|nr:methylated-DNA--[protein]-cysteine S-methyltransferase [Planctomycetota bacterium]